MAKMDWEKANRREMRIEPYAGSKKRIETPYQKEQKRQKRMAGYVRRNKLVCFVCKRNDVEQWAKTGRSKYGPWAICMSCVKRRRARDQESAEEQRPVVFSSEAEVVINGRVLSETERDELLNGQRKKRRRVEHDEPDDEVLEEWRERAEREP